MQKGKNLMDELNKKFFEYSINSIIIKMVYYVLNNLKYKFLKSYFISKLK